MGRQRKVFDEEKIILLYKQGLSQQKIALIYNTSQATIGRILKNNYVETRINGRKYKINESYFDNIDTQNKAYILGFIYADGFIRKDNLALSVVVHNKDLDILTKIKKELNSDIPIEHMKNKEHSRINICNKQICDSLNIIGCSNNKTFNLQFPEIRENLVPHFIRGFMDGDGCISVSYRGNKKYFSLSFTGTKEMMIHLKKILNVDNKITFYRNAYALHIGKKDDVLRILDLIYNNANLYLDRKYDKYIEIEQYVSMVKGCIK